MSIQATPTGVPAAKAVRTQPIVSALQATRASERQAARQKARGQPKTPRIEHSSAKWVIGETRSDERKWLTKIVAYLHSDPAQETNPRILRFMLKEWPALQASDAPHGGIDGKIKTNSRSKWNSILATDALGGS